MKVCLVSPPTVTDLEDPAIAGHKAIRLIAEHAPVGVLSLAAVLDKRNIETFVVDLNRLYYQYLQDSQYSLDTGAFFAYLKDYFATLSFDVFGLSTICSSYPLTLRLAAAIKKNFPQSLIILGGPQASVVDMPTLDSFPAVDFIVRGEAEETFPALLQALATQTDYRNVPGISFREADTVVRTPPAPLIGNLDDLPLPAYHLYPHMTESQYIALELGRGCPFACKFCSTNDFFRRNFRLKSPQHLIAEMKTLKETYHLDKFDLIHDMFTVDRRKVVAFCDALLASGESFYWDCSARTDCVSEDLIALMAQAGCRGIFFGIETGSQRMQKLVKKNIDLGEAMGIIACTNRHQISTTISLITGFPDETLVDLRDTIAFIGEALSFEHVTPHLHILAPLAETPYHAMYREQLTLDGIFSDMSYQGWRQDPLDENLIAGHPDIFPNFYAVPTPLDRTYLKEIREFLLYSIQWFRWLMVALHQSDHHLGDVFDYWVAWQKQTLPDLVGEETRNKSYYARPEFRRDFLQFMAQTFIPQYDPHNQILVEMVKFEGWLDTLAMENFLNSPGLPPQPLPPLTPATKLTVASGVYLKDLNFDYNHLLQTLKTKGALKKIPLQAQTLVLRKHQGQALQFIQLQSPWLTMLHFCQQQPTVSEFIAQFKENPVFSNGLPPEMVCTLGLELLNKQGLITIVP